MKRITIMVLLTLTVCLLYSCINDGQKDGNTSAKDEPQVQCFYTYDILWTYSTIYDRDYTTTIVKNGDNSNHEFAYYGGLAVKVAYTVADDSPSGYSIHEEYLQFDDEANYDSEIYEWRLACNIAYDLFRWNCENSYTKGGYFKQDLYYIAQLLTEIRNLPSNIDDNMDHEISEIFKKNYYDLKEKPIYSPEKGYGFREYPYDLGRDGKPKSSIRLKRFDQVRRLGKYSQDKIDGMPNGTLILLYRSEQLL